MAEAASLAPGLSHYPGRLDLTAQRNLLDAVRAVMQAAPLFTPTMPRTGKPFSVRMTNCGQLGWVSDRDGYRYQEAHPDTGAPWPPMPEAVLALWDELSGYSRPPQACLVNWYGPGARMGLHQDRDEDDFEAPVLSVSLGDAAVFRFGGTSRRGPTRSATLESGDVLVLAGPARLAFHGVDRTVAGSSELIEGGGRINLTLRRVTRR